MLEVIASAKFAKRHKLTAAGDGLLVIDGPEGFALTVTHMGGSPRRVGGVGGQGEAIGRQRLFKAGSFTARQRVGIWTNGPTSHIHVTEA